MRLILSFLLATGSVVQVGAQTANWMPDLTQRQAYTWHLASSSDPTGANMDFRIVDRGETVTVLDAQGKRIVIAICHGVMCI